MTKTHNTYSPEEKKQIILDILSRKTNIQKIAAQKGIAPTLISLWKKQAEDAIAARFQPQARGRRKAEKPAAVSKRGSESLKSELRKARTKATRAENSLKKAKTRLSEIEAGIKALVGTLGCTVRKARKTRKA